MSDSQTTLPKHLYHYTSQKGLLGILGDPINQSKPRLWMTNILYLNDSSEFTYTINLVKQELMERKENILKDKETSTSIDPKLLEKYSLIEKILDLFLREPKTESYVFSMTNNIDDLNQWRGYCPKEGGFCIQFDYDRLLSLIKMTNTFENLKYEIIKCEYDLTVQRDLIKSLIDNNIDNRSFFSKLIYLSSYIKDYSFQSEDEYRIIYSGKKNGIHYREGKSMIVPFIEFELPFTEGLLQMIPISKIIVGPTPHKHLSKVSIERLIKSKNYEIEVETSKIPYRSW